MRVRCSERCTTPAVVAAAVLQCLCRLVVSQQCHCLWPCETTRRSSRRRRGGALVLVVERSRRPAPDAVAAPDSARMLLMGVGRGTGRAECGPQPSARSAPLAHLATEEWPPPTPSSRRWPGLLLTGTRLATGECDLRDTAERTPSGHGDTARHRRVDRSPRCGAEGQQSQRRFR